MYKDINGRISSLQSLGAVDGPGIRFVVFMQGCPLRCIYCHNPETWDISGGIEMSVSELTEKILRYKPYFKNGGGVTVSGGEPLMQAEFVTELFKALRAEGIHTALDTSGVISGDRAAGVLQYTDLVLADLKFLTEEEYKNYAGGRLKAAEDFLELTEKMGIPLWVRHVVVPGITDTAEYLKKIKKKAEGYSNLEKIEWLPFHNMCKEKYDEQGINFGMGNTPGVSDDRLELLLKNI